MLLPTEVNGLHNTEVRGNFNIKTLTYVKCKKFPVTRGSAPDTINAGGFAFKPRVKFVLGALTIDAPVSSAFRGLYMSVDRGRPKVPST